MRVNITLREFLDLTQPTITISANGFAATVQNIPERLATVVKQMQSYVTKDGDTLKAIAQKFFGSVEAAEMIYAQNREQIDVAAAKSGAVKGTLCASVNLTLPSYARPVDGAANMAELTLKTPAEISQATADFSGIRGAFSGRYHGNNVW